MRLRHIFKTEPKSPSIFADLIVEVENTVALVNVEETGWLERWQDILPHAHRVGLVHRSTGKPVIWLAVNGEGESLRYLSRVIGKIDDVGHRQVRVAGLEMNGASVWLHRDGLVEVGPEPTWRE